MAAPFSPSALATELDAALPRAFGGKLCVAFSGGLDSTALLQALAALREQRSDWSLRAVHIDHQLQAASGDWARRCAAVAEQLRVPLAIERVSVQRDHSQGLEAAARDARYAVLRTQLQHGEALLTAHHADDQVETLLLALMRGAGVPGLAAMPVCAPFACGWHLRPLLSFTRAQLAEWAQANGIVGIDDPSNRDTRHDRNYLRHAVLPALRERWPSMAASVVRSSGHLRDSLLLLEEQAAHDLVTCALGPCLDVNGLKALGTLRRRNVLRYWLRNRGLDAPSTRKLLSLEHDMLCAAGDRNPCVTWPGAEVHRHRGLLYAMPPLPEAEDASHDWDWQQPLALQSSVLRLEPSDSGLAIAQLPARLTVRCRQEGDSLQLAGRPHSRLLKKLLQESGVLPWWRDRLPIVCSGKRIVAIADLWATQEFAAAPGDAAVRIVWDDKPRVMAESSDEQR